MKKTAIFHIPEDVNPLFLEFDAKLSQYNMLPIREAFAQLTERGITDRNTLNTEAYRSWITMMKSYQDKMGKGTADQPSEILATQNLMRYEPFEGLHLRVDPFTGREYTRPPDLTDFSYFEERYPRYNAMASFSALLYGYIFSPQWTVEEFFGLIHMHYSARAARIVLLSKPAGTIMLRVSMRIGAALNVSFLDNDGEIHHLHLSTKSSYSHKTGSAVERIVHVISSKLDRPTLLYAFTQQKRLEEFDWYNESKKYLEETIGTPLVK